MSDTTASKQFGIVHALAEEKRKLIEQNTILREALERLSVFDSYPFPLQLTTIWKIASEALQRAGGEGA